MIKVGHFVFGFSLHSAIEAYRNGEDPGDCGTIIWRYYARLSEQEPEYVAKWMRDACLCLDMFQAYVETKECR